MAGIVLLAVEAAITASELAYSIYNYVNRPEIGMSPLQDLQLTSGSDGAPIPFGFGTVRIAGAVIWAPKIKFTIPTGDIKGYLYTASFAATWGEGPGVINRVWGDSKVIWKGGLPLGQFAPYDPTIAYVPEDLVSSNDPNTGTVQFFSCLFANTGIDPHGNNLWWQDVTATYPTWHHDTVYPPGSDVAYGTGNPPTGQVYASIAYSQGDTPGTRPDRWVPLSQYYGAPTIYPGTEAQNPDPLIQAAQGASKTPAYRPLIYGVWDTFPIANFGNRLPNLRAEVTYG